MAQLPASMRRRHPATTSIHDKPPHRIEPMLGWASWLLLALACAVLLFGAYALYQRFNKAHIAYVQIAGASQAEQQYLDNYLRPVVQGSYFTTDLEVIRDSTLALSWVDRVVVSRAWPDTIVVRVTPRHAIARWGTGRLLSDDGVVFQPVENLNVANLPLLHGPVSQSRMMMVKYRDISQLFIAKKMYLKELYLTDRMTWFMQFDTGLRVIVDQEQTMSKLQRLSTLANSDLSAVWDQISAIDLRYRNGLALQWKNGHSPQILNGNFVLPYNAAAPVVDERFQHP